MSEKKLREFYREWTSGSRPPADILKRMGEEHVRTPGELTSAESQIFAKLASVLLDKSGLLDRVAFARTVAGAPHTPPAVVLRLIDDDHLVASAAIECAPLCDLDLLKLVATRDAERLQTAIAHRRVVSETLCDVLVGRGRPEVHAALAANPGARLSRAALETLCDAAVRNVAVGKALQKRTDLSPQTEALLARRLEARRLVTADLRDGELCDLLLSADREADEVAIASRTPVSTLLGDFLIARGRMRVLLTLAGNIGAKLSPRALETLGAMGRDTPEMDDALARRGDLPAEVARDVGQRIAERMRLRIDALAAKELARGRRGILLRQPA